MATVSAAEENSSYRACGGPKPFSSRGATQRVEPLVTTWAMPLESSTTDGDPTLPSAGTNSLRGDQPLGRPGGTGRGTLGSPPSPLPPVPALLEPAVLVLPPWPPL